MLELSSFRPFEPNEETREERCIGNGILFETTFPLIRASYPVARSSIRRGTTIQCALVPILASTFFVLRVTMLQRVSRNVIYANRIHPLSSNIRRGALSVLRHHRLSPKLLAKAFSPSFPIRPSLFPSMLH